MNGFLSTPIDSLRQSWRIVEDVNDRMDRILISSQKSCKETDFNIIKSFVIAWNCAVSTLAYYLGQSLTSAKSLSMPWIQQIF